MSKARSIETVFPLSPLQEGMLFHSLYAPESGIYVEQLCCELVGRLDLAAFERAWGCVLARHSILRTAFVWKRQQRPLQVVRDKVKLQLSVEDWRALPLGERQLGLEAFLEEDRRRGFELSRAPLLRLALIRCGEELHQLVWTTHHLLLDGWSLPLLLREALQFYDAFACGRELELPAARPYSEYLEWLGRRDPAASEAFWRRELAGFTAPTVLGLDRGKPGDPLGPEQGERRLRLCASATAALEGEAQRHHLTLSTLVQAAWGTLLSRLGGGEDVVFGVTVSGRAIPLAGVESMVGLFINTLPLRVRPVAKEPLLAWLQALQQWGLELQRHEHSPLAHVQGWSEVGKGQPLFESILVLENYSTAATVAGQMGEVRIGRVRFAERTNYPLTLLVTPGDELDLRLAYDRSRFGGSDVRRMLEHLRQLLEGLAAGLQEGKVRVGELPLLSLEERWQLAMEWNDTAVAYPVEGCLHELVAAQAARTPGAVAVEFEGNTLTYRELDLEARRLARHLRELGVGPEVRVGICAERSLEMVVGLLGILQAGGAYVPLDPGYPAERLAFMVEDARVPVLLTQERLLGVLPRFEARVLCLDSVEWKNCLGKESEGEEVEELLAASGAGADHLAYVIYTSGSTGRPKGAMNTHRGIVNRLLWMQEAFGIGHGDRVLQKTPFSFDVSVWEFFWPLMTGARLVMALPGGHQDPEYLVRRIVESKVTTIHFVPSMLQVFAEAPGIEACTSLERVIASGEALPADLVARLAARLVAPVYNLYGPTEAAVDVTWWPADPAETGKATVPIGRPVANTEIHLLDAELRPVPVGVAGELYIGGIQPARGYLGRPELMAERFVPDPLAFPTDGADGVWEAQQKDAGRGAATHQPHLGGTLAARRLVSGGGPGARLYRTGDLARRLAGGEIEYLGRLDDQVKIRGFRIELGEIEAVLGTHPAVREAAVVAVAGDEGRGRLVGFVAGREGEAPVAADLRAFLESRLPAYMVPAVFIPLDALPLTPSGKVDRKDLGARALAPAAGREQDYAPPTTPMEKLLAEVWGEVLGIGRRGGRVGVHDNFFALGGDSIVSLQIVARVAQAGCRITPRQLFDHPTIAELAELAENAAAGEPAGTAAGAVQGPVVGPVPATPIQRWFLERDLPDPHHFNQAVLLRVVPATALELPAVALGVTGRESIDVRRARATPDAGAPAVLDGLAASHAPAALDPATAARAWAALLVHHDALRLRFFREEGAEGGWGRPWNAGPGGPLPFVHVDLSASSAPREDLERAAGQVQASLDLARGPLARAAWLDLPGGEARLLLAVHHLAVDGVSWRVLLADLETACRQLLAGEPVALPPKTTSFRYWAERLVEHARSAAMPRMAEELAWWLAQGKGASARLPVDRPWAPNTVASQRAVSVELDAADTDALLRLAPAAYRARVEEALLTALAQALSSPGEALLVDLEGHGREEILQGLDLSRTVGWFTSLYPLRLELPSGGESSPGDALRAVKERVRSVPGKGVGYGLLRYLRGGEEAACLRTLPAAEVVFNYLGQLDRALPAGALFAPAAEPPGPPESLRSLRAHSLVINALVAGGRLRADWSYSALRFDDATVEGLAAGFAARLRALAAHCRERAASGQVAFAPSDFPLARLDQAGLDALLPDLQDAEDLYPLSPLQEGILFHSVYAPGSGVYVEQLLCRFAGEMDAAVMEEAWRRVVAHNPVLRTSFLWRGLERPLQAVHAGVPVALEREDWGDSLDETGEEMRTRLDVLLAADRARGFDIGRAPLMRWRLVVAGAESVLLWTHHHLLLDGWSYSLVAGDFMAAYAALAEDREPRLPRRRPYREYIAWFARQDLGRAEEFWRSQLAGWTEPTPLPRDRQPEEGWAAGVATRELPLPAVETAALGELARQERLTLNTLVAGAWGLLLGRYAGRGEVLFGATVAGRPPDLPGAETMVGLFINTLPVRLASGDGWASALAWFRALQKQLVELRQHEQAPLARIQGWSEVPRGLPLFESILVFENYPREASMRQGGDRLGVRDVRAVEQTNFPLSMAVVPGETLLLRADYDRSRFEGATVERLLGHLRTLLAGLAAGDLRRRMEDLSLLSAPERHQLRAEWNDTAAAYPLSRRLDELIAGQAARTPGAVAVELEGETLTYRQLDLRARHLARRLRELGVGPEARVGLCAERSLEMVLGLLGILQVGGAYVPLDPSYPAERLSFMVEDARLPVLLTQERLMSGLPPCEARVLSIDAGDLAGEVTEEEPPVACGAGPDQLAYVIYTSGSTGRPKGTMNTHRAIVNRLLWMQEAFGLGPDDRVLQKTPFSFDVSVWELFWPLMTGARLVMARPGGHQDPEYLVRRIVESKVTTLHFVPSMLQAFAEAPGIEACTSIRRVIASGEALPTDLVARFDARLPVPVYNLYGPTEAAVDVTWWPAGRNGHGEPGATVPIGVPVANTQIHLLDADFRPVPVGAQGELYIGGVQPARGYLGRPELTAERFVPDPFGARLYRTGDLARRLPGGEIEYLGRVDDQVKLRGFRIELGEIEAALAAHPGVLRASVVARREQGGDARLAAFLVSDAPIPAHELRAHLASRLPDFMVPATFARLPSLPLNPSGKVDRRALASLEVEAEWSGERERVAPRTGVEARLAEVWMQVLRLPEGRLGVHDNFFELGGDSILTLQVVSRASRAGLRLTPRQVFDNPTVAALAAVAAPVEAVAETPAAAPLPAFTLGNLDELDAEELRLGPGIEDVYPLSPLQEGLLFHSLYAPGVEVYVEQLACTVHGDLEPAIVEAAWRRVVERNAILRTSFHGRYEGRPLQAVHAEVPVALAREDWSALAPAEQELRLAELMDADRRRGFDLSRPPLMRCTLIRTGEGEHRFLWSHHHVLLDGWSYAAVMAEFLTCYGALRAGREPDLPARPPFRDYIAWLETQDLAAAEAYWRRTLSGWSEPTPLAVDRFAPAGSEELSQFAKVFLPPPATAGLVAQARRAQLTLNTLVLGAWGVLLGRYSGKADVVFGTTVSGRPAELPGVEEMVGLFINTLPLRLRFAPGGGGPQALPWLREVQAQQVELRQHEHTPLVKVQAWSEVPRGLPHFESILVFENYPREAALAGSRDSGLDLTDVRGVERTNFPVTVEVVPGREMLLRIGYDPVRFDRATAERMLSHLCSLVEGLAAPGALARRLTDLPLLAPAERHQLLAEWNDRAAPEPAGLSIHGLFEAQAARTPEAPAVLFSEAALTYQQLDERANRVARLLRRLAVEPGDVVAISMRKGLDTVPALLAVLKAGAAYVPLEPEWPAERRAWILDALRVTTILTDSTQLRAVQELQWRLPRLDHAVCLDVAERRPAPEPIDRDAVRGFWDHLSERAADRVSAGGFVSSYTGRPFAEAEVDEYVARVTALVRPRLGPGARVLEVGCGSGLIAFALAGDLAATGGSYLGLDPSEATLERNRAEAAARGYSYLAFEPGFAHELHRLPAASFDLVVVASTAQFFPGYTYLERVVESALRLLAPGGELLLADLLDERRKDELRRSLEEFRGVHRGEADVKTRTQLGSELYVDEGLFADLAAELPEIAAVRVLHRERWSDNELRFRYDVVLEKAAAADAEEVGPRRRGERRKRVWTGWWADRLPARALVPPVDPAADPIAYMIFTSGSTGLPKGLVVRHRPVVQLIDWVNTTYGIGPADRVLFITSLCFDLSVYDVFGLLAAGGSIHVASEADLGDPRELVRLLVEEPLTFWDSAPAALQQLVSFMPPPPELGERPRSLRLVFLSGDWIPVGLPGQVRASFPGARVIALGGATEATVWSNYFPIGEVDPAWRSIPYGRPIANAHYHVLDGDFSLCPVGVPGDLYIGGMCLATGYQDPVQTADRFVPDPVTGEAGARIYRTGDRARYLSDGNLEFLGRSDTQVKIRGFRIEQGEIQAVVQRHPEVRDVVVVVREDLPGDRRLVAYFVPRREPAPVAAELRTFARDRLPEYMVPAAFVALAAFPVTPNGKLDRQALPAPAWGGEERAVYAAPRTAAEELLALIWSDVLGIARAGGRVGVHDNFFALGGDSILSIQVIARAAQAGCRLTPRQLFQHPTVAELAAVAGTAAPVDATQGPVVGPVPLTPVQRWFLEGDGTDRHHFNQALLLALREPLEAAVAARAVELLLAHHDALRLRFRQEADAWRQWNAPPSGPGEPTPFARLDLSGLAPEAARGTLVSATAAAQASLDLAAGPLVRAVWFELPGGERRLLLAIHHLAVDGVSWRVLLEDLELACRQLAAGERAVLPPKTTSFRRWAHHLEEHARALPAEATARELAWWLAETCGESARLPVDRPEGLDTVGSARAVSMALGEEETAALLQEVPAAYRTRIEEVLLTALARALAGPGGSLAVELEGHGREELFERVDLSRTAGWFTSIYPVLLPAGPAAEPGKGLIAVKEHLRSVPGKGIGYGLLRYLRAGDPMAARLAAAPAPEVLFNYLGQVDQALPERSLFAPAAEPGGAVESPRRRRTHALVINAVIAGGRLRLDWSYGAARQDAATVERLAAAYLGELRALVAHCRTAAGRYTPSDFPLAGLAQAELDQVLGSERGIEDLYPLAPVQEGILFHTLLAPGSGLYVEQLSCRARGEIDVAAFGEAWRRIVERNAVLRTSFRGLGTARPLQAVHARVAVEVERQDWRGLPEEESERRFAMLVAADCERGFDPARPPLMRWKLVRTEEREHRFLWSHHHALLDGWSYAAMIGEFLSCYEALRAGREPELPRRRPYREYIDWLGRQDMAPSEEYWRRTLAGWREPTPLVVDRREGAAGAEGWATRSLHLPDETSQAVQAEARRRELTLNALMLGAWGLLLGRYAAQKDVVFGTTVSGRPAELPGVEAMLGLFINTVPVRVRTAGEGGEGLRLLPWLQAIQAEQWELRQHEHTPLVAIQGWSEVPRGVPLFESVLVVENYPREAALKQGVLSLEMSEVALEERANYPLVFVVLPAGRVELRMTYSTSRFEAATIERMLAHVHSLLTSMLPLEDSRRASDLPLLSAAEQHQLLAEWNDTAADRGEGWDPGERLDELFAAQVVGAPEAVALETAHDAMTYGELGRRAEGLAVQLAGLGAGPEVVVGLCLRRSLAMVVATLAVVKSGGAYLPLDPDYPPKRLAFMLRDAGVSILVTEEDLLGAFGEAGRAPGLAVLCLDRRKLLPSRDEAPQGARLLGHAASPDQLAYVMYTSGSTGVPKGVAVPHRAIVRLVHGGFAALGPGQVLLQLAPASFDAATFEIWGALATGARLAIAPPGPLSPDEIGALLARHGVTTLWLTAGLFHQVVEAGAERLAPLSQLLAGGDVLSVGHVRRALAASGGRLRLINGYGPTENTTFTCCHPVRDEADLGGSVPLGRPIGGTRVYVLDPLAAGAPAPIGVPGELCTGGAGLARGYAGRPELTAERFVPAPFGPGDAPGARQIDSGGARLYRTGDLARLLPDGRIEFLGRIDRQVKIRGFRIELGEIEAALGEHPAVREAVVLAREDRPGDRSLVGYLVPAGDPPAPEALRAFLAERLPGFMVPAKWVLLPELPLTANGKVDRAALPAPEARRDPASEDGYIAPRNPVEEVLAGIWEEVLDRERVGVEDDFFALGGHSLLATQVTSRLRRTLGVELPLRVLFESPTVAGVAAHIEQLRRAGKPDAAPPLRPLPRQGDPPLSFSQERMWLLDQLLGTAGINVAVAVGLSGRLSMPVLEAALREIVRRHEVLRTAFVAAGSRPVQRIDPAWRPRLPVVDLAGLPSIVDSSALARQAATRDAELACLTEAEAELPFDLARGPVLRCTLVRLAADDFVLLLSIHHLVSDGWSMGLLVRELTALYAAGLGGEPSPLPELPIQYADFALWQRKWLSGETLERELAHATARLAGLPALDLPTDRPPTTALGFSSGILPLVLPEPLTAGLHALARRQGASLFMTVLAGIQALLSRHTGQDDFAIGAPVAGRNRSELEPLIGFFVNTLVLRTAAGGNPGFVELLERSRAATLEAYDHQDLPFSRLEEALRSERQSAPLLQVRFLWHNQPQPAIAIPGVTVELRQRDVIAGHTNYPLAVELIDTGGRAVGSLGYNRALFDAVTAARWRDHLAILLAGAAEDPGRRLDELPLLAESERHQVLVEWSQGGELVLLGGGAAPIGIWGEVWQAAPDGGVWNTAPDGAWKPTGRRSRRRADGTLDAGAPAPETADIPDEAARAAGTRELVAKRLEDQARRLEQLSPAKRKLLERRLRGEGSPGVARAGASPAVPSLLVDLQPGRRPAAAERPPFFCVHAVGGAVLSYRELARALSPEQPLYGIQAAALVGGKAIDDLPAMAAEYAAAVEAAVPQGPYLLGGWSFGGVVAFEMACQLRARGRQVALVALLDSWAPAMTPARALLGEAEIVRLFLRDQAGLQGLDAAWLDRSAGGPADDAAAIEWLLARSREVGLLKAGLRSEQVRPLLDVYRANLRAGAAYRPRVYAGRLTLFRPLFSPHPTNGWDALTGQPVEVYEMSADHYSLLAPPAVAALAGHLRTSIERVTRPSAPAEPAGALSSTPEARQ